jgi:hypothetical protein
MLQQQCAAKECDMQDVGEAVSCFAYDYDHHDGMIIFSNAAGVSIQTSAASS